MYTASEYNEAAWAIRYPRGNSTGMDVREGFQWMEIGKGREIRKGEGVAILSFGPIGNYVTEAFDVLDAEGVRPGHYDMRYAKPLDTELLDRVAAEYDHLITIEDGTRLGGFGSAVSEYLMQRGADCSLTILGIPDRIVEHGTQRELHDEVGIGPDGIVQAVRSCLEPSFRS
jgi:1-deoxy-D-xylulose-5-phosphate synthase